MDETDDGSTPRPSRAPIDALDAIDASDAILLFP
jgi:hypothetical protein